MGCRTPSEQRFRSFFPRTGGLVLTLVFYSFNHQVRISRMNLSLLLYRNVRSSPFELLKALLRDLGFN
jgi:hypothetical protein